MIHEIIEQFEPMERYVYGFTLISNTVYLEYFYVQKRETARHKFTTIKKESYNRLHSRDYHLREEPDINMELAVAAVQHFRSQIKFKKWEYLK